jgi:hypothetical protein
MTYSALKIPKSSNFQILLKNERTELRIGALRVVVQTKISFQIEKSLIEEVFLPSVAVTLVHAVLAVIPLKLPYSPRLEKFST